MLRGDDVPDGHLLGLKVREAQDGGGVPIGLPAPDLVGVGGVEPALDEGGGLRPVGVAPALQPDGDLRVREDGDPALPLEEVPQGGAVTGDDGRILRSEAGLRLRLPGAQSLRQPNKKPLNALPAQLLPQPGEDGAEQHGLEHQRSDGSVGGVILQEEYRPDIFHTIHRSPLPSQSLPWAD